MTIPANSERERLTECQLSVSGFNLYGDLASIKAAGKWHQAFCDEAELRAALTSLLSIVSRKDKEIAAKQARIDALMLEWCPQDMTPQQLIEWERNQGIAHDTLTLGDTREMATTQPSGRCAEGWEDGK